MTTIRICLCLLALTAGTGVAFGQDPSHPDTMSAQIQADAAAADLSKRLKQTLMAAMSEGGPVGGINACQVQAGRIAEEIAQQYGVSIGRTGVRVRNSDNAAEGWQGDTLEAFALRAAAGEAPESLRQVGLSPDGKLLRVARGIRTEAPCQICHGVTLAAQVQASIQEHYPEDRATGFVEGSLRGLLWVEAPLRPAP